MISQLSCVINTKGNGILTSAEGDEIFQTVMQQTGCGFISKALSLRSLFMGRQKNGDD